jgi:hypothetical protein
MRVSINPSNATGKEPVPIMDNDRTDETLRVFYRTARAGVERLSDDGGPFGFDITATRSSRRAATWETRRTIWRAATRTCPSTPATST